MATSRRRSSKGAAGEKSERRPAGMGAVFYSPARDRYIVRLPPDPVTGARPSRIVRSFRATFRALAELEDERAKGQHQSRTAEKTTTEAFLRRWLEELVKPPQREPATYAVYQLYVETVIVPGVGHIPLARLRPEHVQRLIADCSDPTRARRFAPRTVRLIRGILSTALTVAEEWGLIERNPVKRSRAPRVPREKRPAPSLTDATALVRRMAGPPMTGIVRLALRYGVRESEILGLRDIDVNEQTITVAGQLTRDGAWKGQRKRGDALVLPIVPGIARALAEQRTYRDELRRTAGRAWREHGYLFTQADGRPISQQWVRRRFKEQLVGADLPFRTFHDTRHAANSLLDELGVDLGSRMEVLGHAAVESNLIYTHTTAARLRAGLLKLDEALDDD